MPDEEATVHPRVRGEHSSRRCAASRRAGSSPRARGTRVSSSTSWNRTRFIPACAGNTFPVPPARGSYPVHPRVRGEHRIGFSRFIAAVGSSPRARGTHLSAVGERRRCRFIPACAGNTIAARNPAVTPPVHARVRGEHVRRGENGALQLGSSPRARGTLLKNNLTLAQGRFIPACAGNTAARTFTATTEAVHPRVRREHAATMHARMAVLRFIPACAGNTRITWTTSRPIAVHPRVRGEHQRSGADAVTVSGSSPRARGTLHLPLQIAEQPRFIPACAGNTHATTMRRCSSAVHTRVRGEHTFGTATAGSAGGSSPRARGTPRPSDRRRRDTRFIPACAGNTRSCRDSRCWRRM